MPLLPSRSANSELEMVTPPTVTSFEPRARAVAISESERSIAVPIVAPVPDEVMSKAEAISPVEVLSIVNL